MSRIMVLIDEAICYDTEDVTGADELYVVGAIRTNSGQTSGGFVTRPIGINTNETRKFTFGGGIVFDKEVPDSSPLQIEMIVFDEDASRDVSRYDQARALVDQAITAVPNPLSAVASLPLDAIRTFMVLDQDDELGTNRETLFVGSVPHGWSFHQWNTQEAGLWSSWNYWIRYWIGRF
ncbi:hypothetical protein H6F51_14200 [Cyanobacteria bacterium FACHB-DQ100]|nr:hypothetical protein [Cyanobacteria bacterium FACHB-DQ100]